MPLLVTVLPLLGLGFLLNEAVERTIVLAAVLATGASICGGYRRHRHSGVLLTFGTSIVLLGFGLLWVENNYETVLMVVGAGLLAAGNLFNRHLCDTCPQCQRQSQEQA